MSSEQHRDEVDFSAYADVCEIAIEDPDATMTTLADVELDILDDPSTNGTRLVGLTRGHRERDDPTNRVEVGEGNDADVDLTVYITPDEHAALGLFVHLLEQHGFDEAAAMDGLDDPDLAFDIDTYLGWREQFTVDERRERLLDDAESRRERSPHVATYLDDGSFRTVDPDDDTAQTVGQTLSDGLDANPRRCYRNSIVTLNAVDSLDNIQYVEGLALPKHAGRAVAHAWLEVNGTVVELTWPWHAPLPPESTVYYGVPIETDEVLSTTKRRNMGFNPILLDDEDLFDEAL